MSLNTFRHGKKPSSGLALSATLGATVLASISASAQNGPIVPSVPGAISPIGAAAIPAVTDSPATVTKPVDSKSRIDINFLDIEISALLQLVSEHFGVDVIVADDVTGRLKSISLRNTTPEQAIQRVAETAGLQYRRLEDGTFLIAKNFQTPAPAANNLAAQNPNSSWGSTLPPSNWGAIQPKNNRFNSGTFGDDSVPTRISELPALPKNNGGDSELPSLVPTKQSQKKRTQYLALRNVRPGIMAYWLDPASNDRPREYQKSDKLLNRLDNKAIGKPAVSPENLAALKGNSSNVLMPGFQSAANNPYLTRNSTSSSFNSNSSMFPVETRESFQLGGGGGRRGGAGGAAGGVFNLPDGVDRIVAIDPQNALLVFGTDEGVRQLQDIIGKLDVPLRQVEIESQFVTVSTTDSRAFGIDYLSALGNFTASTNGFAPSPTTGTFSVGYTRGNFQATLQNLVSTNRAKVITAPRVLAINNLTASLQSETSTPIILTSSTSNIGGTVQGSQDLIYITTSVGLTVTPTINNDDTITVYMVPEFSSQTPSGLSNGAPVVSTQTVETIANVHDGETIALGGLKTKNVSVAGGKIPLVGDIPLIGKLFKTRTALNSESDLIIFLTARIVRHLGDDYTPGTN